MNENEQTVVNAIMTHRSWSLESLRLEPLETAEEFAEAMAEVMACSLALDDGAFAAFITLVVETQAVRGAWLRDEQVRSGPQP